MEGAVFYLHSQTFSNNQNMAVRIKTRIRFTSVLEKITDITERNKVFKKMDDQSKRLEMAWDALKLVAEGTLVSAEYGYWDQSIDDHWWKFADKDTRSTISAEDTQKAMLTLPPRCGVCARGAVMVSRIRLGNQLDSNCWNIEKGDDSSIVGFSIWDMHSMENEYEESRYKHPYKNNTVQKLANIMCNVLINGNFDINDRTDYLTSKK
jgi:hypothetical protein